jgi:hypothetical protein
VVATKNLCQNCNVLCRLQCVRYSNLREKETDERGHKRNGKRHVIYSRSLLVRVAYLVPAGIVALPADALRREVLRQKPTAPVREEGRVVGLVVGARRLRDAKVGSFLSDIRARTVETAVSVLRDEVLRILDRQTGVVVASDVVRSHAEVRWAYTGGKAVVPRWSRKSGLKRGSIDHHVGRT